MKNQFIGNETEHSFNHRLLYKISYLEVNHFCDIDCVRFIADSGCE